jgi:hypothetical protein
VPVIELVSATLVQREHGGTPIMLYLIGMGGEPRQLRATAVAYVILSTAGSLIVLDWTGG